MNCVVYNIIDVYSDNKYYNVWICLVKFTLKRRSTASWRNEIAIDNIKKASC